MKADGMWIAICYSRGDINFFNLPISGNSFKKINKHYYFLENKFDYMYHMHCAIHHQKIRLPLHCVNSKSKIIIVTFILFICIYFTTNL